MRIETKILFFLSFLICFVILVSSLAQTVPVPSTRTLQNGISVGLGIWAEPDPTLMGKAISVCAGTDAMACVSAQNAIGTNAQQRAQSFMNDIYHNYPNINTSLANQGLWFKGQ